MENNKITKNSIKIAKYRHFKGGEYQVLGIGRHSETLEEFVVYQGLYDSPEFGKNPIWVRPISEFLEVIERDGKKFSRFELMN